MIFLIPAAILAIIGYMIKYKKITWLISGYNTATVAQKAQYDIEKLCKYMGNYIFILGFLFLMLALLTVWFADQSTKIIIAMGIVIAITAIGGIIYLSCGDRVKKAK